jgi:hypothetical protein
MCTSDDGSGRYIYYLHTTTFWRYDTWTDGWQQLASPLVAGATSAALKYSIHGGWRGHVLAATTNTVTIPGLKSKLLMERTDNSPLKIRILAGTGAGQERTLTAVAEPVVADHGNATGGSTATVVDSTKLWKFNQWRGYQVRITYGAGAGQIRKILYNDQTTLYVSSNNHQPVEPFGNALFVTAAAAGSFYQIESSIATVDSNWTVTPDVTSTFVVLSGGIWYVTTAGTPGWAHMSYYDVHSDVWYPKTVPMGNLAAALGTDWCIERTGEVGGQFYGPVAATNAGSNTLRTFTDTAATGWAVDQWAGYQLRITLGTGAGQRRRIIGNTATTLTVQRAFDGVPGATDTYQILGDTDKIYMAGNANSALHQYSIENDLWSFGPQFDWGVARIGSIQLKTNGSLMGAQEPIGIASIVYAAAGILTAVVTAAGTGYTRASIGAVCTVAGTTGGTVMITGVNASGGVSSVLILNSGSAGTAAAQAITGGVGTGCTVTITVGKVGLVTTAINHNLQAGDPFQILGALTDTNWNGYGTILGAPSLTTLSIAPPNGAAAASPTFTATTTALLVDASQNWAVNELTGKILLTFHTPTAPGIYTLTALNAMRITSNTANTITTPAMTTAGVNGVSRYVICDIQAFGREEQYKILAQAADGYASGGTGTTLVDSSKNWLLNQWTGYRVRVIAGTGLGNEAAITGSTSNTLTVASWPVATPDATSKYLIMDTFGNATGTFATTGFADSTKNWVPGSLVGKRLKFMGGVNSGNEVAITANTANTVTYGAVTISDANMSYSIISPPVRGTNLSLQWMFNPSKYQKGRFLISPRGNSPFFDTYDIGRNTWDVQPLFTPQTENLVVGSMFAYDGADRLYFTVGATGRVLYLDLATGMIQGSSQTPFAHGAGLAGNRMELVSTADGLDYLFIMRHTGAEFWRTLAFWSAW